MGNTKCLESQNADYWTPVSNCIGAKHWSPTYPHLCCVMEGVMRVAYNNTKPSGSSQESIDWGRSWSWSSSCGRQSVYQFIWVSGLPLGPLTRFYLALLSSSDNYFILLSRASTLTRKRVCSLQCNHSLVRLLTPNNHTLLSHLRLCSLFVASCDSQGLRWRYSNPPPHGVSTEGVWEQNFYT
jgi:hypothetical protein